MQLTVVIAISLGFIVSMYWEAQFLAIHLLLPGGIA